MSRIHHMKLNSEQYQTIFFCFNQGIAFEAFLFVLLEPFSFVVKNTIQGLIQNESNPNFLDSLTITLN